MGPYPLTVPLCRLGALKKVKDETGSKWSMLGEMMVLVIGVE